MQGRAVELATDPFLGSKTYISKTRKSTLKRRAIVFQYLNDKFLPTMKPKKLIEEVGRKLGKKVAYPTISIDLRAYEQLFTILNYPDGKEVVIQSKTKVTPAVRYFLNDWKSELVRPTKKNEEQSEERAVLPGKDSVEDKVDQIIALLKSFQRENAQLRKYQEKLNRENSELRTELRAKNRELSQVSKKLDHALKSLSTGKREKKKTDILSEIKTSHEVYSFDWENEFENGLRRWERSGCRKRIIKTINYLIREIDRADELSFGKRKLGKTSRFPGSILVTISNDWRIVYKEKGDRITFQSFCIRRDLDDILGQSITC